MTKNTTTSRVGGVLLAAALAVPAVVIAQTPPNSMVVDTTGYVGIGTATPSRALNVVGDDVNTSNNNITQIRAENTNATVGIRTMLFLSNNGDPRLVYQNTETNKRWSMNPIGPSFRISQDASGLFEMSIEQGSGNVTIGGTLTEGSDRARKQDIESLDAEDVLSAVSEMPITEWSYKAKPEERHIGPMAQDFYAAFGLGQDEKHLSARNLASVSILAIQAQQAHIEKLNAEKQELSDKVDAMMKRMAEMTEKLEQVQQVVIDMAPKKPSATKVAY